MDHLYSEWKYGKVLVALRHYAMYYQADEVWMAMYTWTRAQAFLSAELDPRATARAAKEAWRNLKLPEGSTLVEGVGQPADRSWKD